MIEKKTYPVIDLFLFVNGKHDDAKFESAQ